MSHDYSYEIWHVPTVVTRPWSVSYDNKRNWGMEIYEKNPGHILLFLSGREGSVIQVSSYPM